MDKLKVFYMVWEADMFIDAGSFTVKRPVIVEHVDSTLDSAIEAAKFYLNFKYPLDKNWELVRAAVLEKQHRVTELEI